MAKESKDVKHVCTANFINGECKKMPRGKDGEPHEWKKGKLYTGSDHARLLKEKLIEVYKPAKTPLDDDSDESNESGDVKQVDDSADVTLASGDEDAPASEDLGDGEEPAPKSSKKMPKLRAGKLK